MDEGDDMDRVIIGGEKTPPSKPWRLRVTLGFLINLVGTVVAIVLTYSAIQSKLDVTAHEAERALSDLREQREMIHSMQRQQSVTQQMLDDFRSQYEWDTGRQRRPRPIPYAGQHDVTPIPGQADQRKEKP